MKLVDEVIKIHEVIKGVEGELTTVDDGHKHEIKIDSKGNGKTITTLGADGAELGKEHHHSHAIVKGEVKSQDDHDHAFTAKG